jgi:hypothetical protein
METTDLPNMLHGHGAEWTTIDLTDDEIADLISGLSDADRASMKLSPALPRYVPQRSPDWQTTDDQHHHLDQPFFADGFAKARWFDRQATMRLAQLADLTGDRIEASRLRMEAAAQEMMTEADLLVEEIQKR